ncbi:polysaccharide lyase 8 family protein [Streptomyces sp. CSDS2]|uniref:polysaccharide lyase 8 family protein n=1 Tax=Streptomyces sp. CSDS2 TaxID=3055051 RepID=UPI0025B1204A|nr:polysaccharide lyase 8 family protein [Streptomyces sp. CSDS2]MDN3264458.1 polysaccharide lyase 8 family protein [Streptomyces sp. CSDS2]
MTSRWSRRSFLAAGSGTAAVLGLGTTWAFTASDEFSALRARWRALILGEGFDPAAEPFRSRLAALGGTAGRYLATMAPAAGSLWPDLVYAVPEPDTDNGSYVSSSRLHSSYTRLSTLAQAYCQPGTGLTGAPRVRDALLAGLGHLHDDVYHPGQVPYGNWYTWQIGVPQALLDLCVLLYDALPDTRRTGFLAAVDHFVPDSVVAGYTGSSTGANRVDLCRVLALRGVVGADAGKVALARDALSPVFRYVTSGDGLYADGSFIQHRSVPYAGSYGSVLLGGLGLLLALLAGSGWEVTDPGRRHVFDAVERAWAPFVYNGLVMDGVSGRAISRGRAAGARLQHDDHTRGHAVLASIALLGQGAGAAEDARWRGLVKGWMERDRCSPPLADPTLSVSHLARLKGVQDDASVPAVPEPTGHRLFPCMARATHRRPGWAASLSMADRRISHYETGDGENLRGWHTGSGMLYWWGATFGGDQYSNAFWPTVDPYRLPGTTVSRKVLADGAGGDWGGVKPDVRWVGGATDGQRAAVGQYLKGFQSTLRAKKSWFFLDDTVVCLGAGITCADGTAVQTTVDNRNLGAAGDAPFTADGTVESAGARRHRTLTGAKWAHLGGHGGYVFPGGATVRALREARDGSWSLINKGGSTDVLTRTYQTLYVDHGTDPTDATYAYVLLPGATAEATRARAADSGWLDVLANSNRQQGVSVPSAGLTGVNFWFGGTAGALTASDPCCVVVCEQADGTAVIVVSDPMRVRTGLTVIWRRPVTAVMSAPATLVSSATGAELTLRFGDLSGTAGAGQRVTVGLGRSRRARTGSGTP